MNDARLNTLIDKVQANKKYQPIAREFIRRLCQDALEKGLSGKPAVKAVRNKLHQVGGAYINRNVDYSNAEESLRTLPSNHQAEKVKKFCRQYLESHASTAERLPILEDFFQTTLASIAPVHSILDLACGLNPLAIPWMPLAPQPNYHACDIYLDMLGLIKSFFNHFKINGEAQICDLLGEVPNEHAQVAFILKSIPCLEQVDKSIGPRLLDALQTDHILVSFPVRSLGGRKKGMHNFYRDHFYEMVSGKTWEILEFTFKTELAFLVTK